jgi:ABC transporter fused permease/ATP-binding protein
MVGMDESKSAPPVPLSRLLALARPEWRLLSVATVALVIGSGMSLVYPQAVRWMVDAITADSSYLDFDSAALLLLVMFAVQAVFTMLRSWLFTVAGERVVARLRSDLFASILGRELAFFDVSRTGELTNRLASDTTVLQNTVTVNVSMALRFTFGAIGGVLMLLYMSFSLAGMALAVVPVVAVGASIYGRVIRRLSTEVQDALAGSTEVAEEAISGLRTVRAFAREEAESERYAAAVHRSYLLAAKRALAVGVFSGVTGFAGYAAIALVVWYGGHMVEDGTMTMGDLTAFLLYTMLVAVSLGALSGLYSDFMKASGASRRVFQLLDADRGLESPSGTQVNHVDGTIVFQDVGFAYPSRPDVVVLDGVNLSIARGEVVACVGPSGAGKSTLAALICRFYDPNSGVIELDGVDLRSLDPKSLRTHIGVVAQEPILFATSIAENIRYGRPEASDEAVRDAARAANAEAFIDDFPEAFETAVGERGVRLSGGQKQRIAIARALLKDPAILVLDEATSALDSESEHLVQEALDRLMEGRTTLVIAHRLSTVRGADRVLVLDGGRVVEQGTHDALVSAPESLYRRLVERQFASASA